MADNHYRCTICHFDVEYDDVVVSSLQTGRCVCLRCYEREVGDDRHMSKELRRQVSQATEDVS